MVSDSQPCQALSRAAQTALQNVELGIVDAVTWESFESAIVEQLRPTQHPMVEAQSLADQVPALSVVQRLSDQFQKQLSGPPLSRQFLTLSFDIHMHQPTTVMWSFARPVASEQSVALIGLNGHMLGNYQVVVSEQELQRTLIINGAQDWKDAAKKYGVQPGNYGTGISVNWHNLTSPLFISWFGVLSISDGLATKDGLLVLDTLRLPHMRWSQPFIERIGPLQPLTLPSIEYGDRELPDDSSCEILRATLDKWKTRA